MRNGTYGLVLASILVLSSAGYAQSKCDFKEEIDGADLPACRELHSGGRYCPVLRARNGMLHPNTDKVWAYPNVKDNFEVEDIFGKNLTRFIDGCLRPQRGFEWVDPADPDNFAVSAQGSAVPPGERPPCVSVGPEGLRVLNSNLIPCKKPEVQAVSAAASQVQVTGCSPQEVAGKHGTLNIYRVPFNGDGHGHGISHSIWINFRMFDNGRIEAPLKYDNDSKEAFCGGVHIRLSDINNNAIAEFYSDPHQCVNGRPLISLGGGAIEQNVSWNLQTTPEVACRYAHLYIVPNYDHAATSATAPNKGGGTTVTFFNGSQYDLLYIYRADAPQGAVINCNTMARYIGTISKEKTWSATVSAGQQSHFWFQRVMDNGCDMRNNQSENTTVGVSGRNATAFQNIQ